MRGKLKIKFRTNKERYWVRFIITLMFVWPFIMALLYKFKLINANLVSLGELLSYYGVVFGIYGSFITYRQEKRKNEKEKLKSLKPILSVEVKRAETAEDFYINISKISKNHFTQVFFYDEYLDHVLRNEYNIKTSFNKDLLKNTDSQYNILCDENIIDKDGYPKYVQILCDDIEGNTWNCCYDKVKYDTNIYYYPGDVQII